MFRSDLLESNAHFREIDFVEPAPTALINNGPVGRFVRVSKPSTLMVAVPRARVTFPLTKVARAFT